MKIYLITIVSLLGFVSGRLPASINFQKCPRHGPSVGTCLIKAIDEIRPMLLGGIQEIRFPSLDPFKMDVMELNSQNITGMKLVGTATNIEARGGRDLEIQELKINERKKRLDTMVFIPKLTVAANYDSSGTTIFKMPAGSSGRFTAELTDIKAKIRATGTIEKFGELEYLHILTVRASICFGKTSKMHIAPDQTDENTQLITDLINSLNAIDILKWLKDPINHTAQKIIRSYVNKVLDQLPLQDILLDD